MSIRKPTRFLPCLLNYQDARGGHPFNRSDTKTAEESRKELWRSLAGYVKPDHGAN